MLLDEGFEKNYPNIKRIKPFKDLKETQGQVLLSKQTKNFNSKYFEYEGLGKKSLIVLNPEFLRVNFAKKSNQFNYNFAIEKQKQFNENLLTNAKKSGIEMHLLDVKTLNINDIDKWNDINDLLNFQKEIQLTKELKGFVSAYGAEINTLSDKYNSSDIMLTSAFSLKTPKNMYDIAIPLVYCIAIIPIPFALYSLIRPNEHSIFNSEIISLKNGNVNYKFENYLKLKNNKGVIGTHVYFMFNDVKKASE